MPRGVRRQVAEAVAPEPVQEPAAVLAQPVSGRADEMRRERRRRNDGDLDRMAAQKLAIPKDIQDRARREGKVVRWIMDTAMTEAHANDWDKVEGVEPVQANPREGTTERLVLHEKFADWDAEDRKRDDNTVDAIEERMMAGQVESDGRSSNGLHVPQGQRNRVSRSTMPTGV